MRVIAGKLKYKKLHYKKNTKLRPTRSIVRKSFFDTIKGVIEGSVFLDLFAGSGSLGMEALSRGAKKVIFVDNSKESISLINQNTKGAENVEIVKSDAERFLESDSLKSVDLAYIDPPYKFDSNSFLKKFFSKVNRNAIVCVEHDKKTKLDDKFGAFKKFKSRTFGKNTLDYYGVSDE